MGEPSNGMVGLLPCPFCGTDDPFVEPTGDASGTVRGGCRNPDCVLFDEFPGNYRDAFHFAEWWNTRLATSQEQERLSDILDTERYKVAIALQGIKRAIDGRRWLSEPGRGAYTYDDERYQAEFGQALDEIDEALKPLRNIAGDWSDCPRDPLRVAANRSAALSPTNGEQNG